MVFGAAILISAFAVFPNESSWGSIYGAAGGGILTAGFYLRIKFVLGARKWRILCTACCIGALFGFLQFQIMLPFHNFIRYRVQL